jgi:hypothetical protein
MNNIVTTSPNTNVIVVTSPGPAGQKGDRGITGLPGTINSNSGLNITGSSVFSGSANGEPTLMIIGSNVITGSLTVSGSNTFINIGPAKFTGSVDITGSLNVNGVFSGSGANLFDIPASGITGLNLSRIAVGNVTASVGTGSTWFNVSADGASKLSINSFGQVTIPNTLNVQGQSTLSSTLISGVTTLIGSATLNGQPITTAGDLTLDRIKSGDVTASVSNGANAFALESAGSSLFKVSNSGILSGSGANLFNIPAAGIVGLNLSQIADSSVTASISATNGFKVNTNSQITGSLVVTAGISGSVSGAFQGTLVGQSFTTGSLTGSFSGDALGTFSGSFIGDGAQLTNLPASSIVGLNLSQIATGSVTSSVNLTGTIFNVSSGSNSYLSVSTSSITVGSGSLIVSRSVNAYNINTGTPTSNQWQSNLNGSYFNNFTSQTDVSEVLRFIAGLLSSSAPDAAPNTKTYGSTGQDVANNGSSGAPNGYVPQSTTVPDIIYLTSKNFTSAGSILFSGKTIYNQTGYSVSFRSVAANTTTVSSSNNTELFGLGPLTSGNATQVNVSASINFVYSDNNSETVTATSQSSQLVSSNTFGTVNGITLAKINTVNPAVIPPAYQDGLFSGLFASPIFSSGVNIDGRAQLSVSSSGFYQISSSIIISSGSSAYSSGSVKTTTSKIFYAPYSQILTNIGTNSLSIGYVGYSILTATSRSLSGVPYLTSATWAVSSSVTGLFNPLYGTSTTLARLTTNGNISINHPTVGSYTASVSSGIINTSNVVYDSTGVTARATSTVPFQPDIVRLSGSISLNIGTGTNVLQGSISPSTFTVVTNGRNKDVSETPLNTLTVPYHTAGTFGQPSASGSLAYFGGGSTNTTLIEYFTSESFRRQFSNSTTLTTQWNQDNALALGNSGALQVKPGFLVNPESSNGYWYSTSAYNASHYKWYMREFNTGATSNRGTLTITTLPASSTDFTTFDVTTSGKIAIGVIFEYQLNNRGGSRVVMFDAVKGAGGYGGSLDNQATSAQYNPFSDNIDIVGGFDSLTNSSGTLTLGLTNAILQRIDATATKVWLVVRYTGTPSNALQRITIS